MKTIATENERLDSVFFKHYGMDFNQKAYDGFMQANAHLCLKDMLDGGDEVILPLIEKQEDEVMEGLYGINL